MYDLEFKVTVKTPWELFPVIKQHPRLEILFHSVHYIDCIRSFLGNPKGNFEKALHELSAEIAFYLYNGWQQESQHHLNALIQNLESLEHEVDCNVLANEQLNFTDLIQDSRFKPVTIEHCKQLIRFDKLYENILINLTEIVSEFSDNKKISQSLLQSMLQGSGIEGEEAISSFSGWLIRIRNTSNFGEFLRTAEQWKKVQHHKS